MTNYYNSLNNEEKQSQLGKCRFMKSEEFSDGVNVLIDKKIVIIGCGAQGLNQGLNMRDSGLDISYVLRQSSIDNKKESFLNASNNKFNVGTYNDLIPNADMVINLTPDKNHTQVINEVMPLMKKNSILSYSHGFNIVEEGLEIREDTTFMVSKRSWDFHVGQKDTLIAGGRPNEGDIIYYPLMNSFFEIQFVEDQEPFFALGQLPVYKLRVTRWEYSSEKLDTGLEAIDSAEDKYTLDQLNYKFTLEIGQVALDGEGSIRLEQDLPTGEPQFLMNEDFTESVLQTQSTYASNTDLDTEAGFDTSSALDDILDFTERNPFGDEDN